jgi:hypothetical protein
MNDFIDMSSGAMGVGGAAYDQEAAAAVELYEHRLGRKMTALERAAVEEAERDCQRRSTMHQLSMAALSPRERRYRGVV